MADLPIIQLDTPVTVPAVPARTYPLLWLQALSVSTVPSDTVTGAGNIELTICPMAADGSGDILGESREVIQTSEMWLAISQVPELQQAIGANLVAAVALKAWVAARKLELAAQQQQS